MAGQYGQTAELAISFQNSFGTPLTNSLYFIPFLNESIALKIPANVSEDIRGIYDEGDTNEGPRTVEGDITANARPIPLGVMFQAMFGAPTTATSDSIYTHTFNPRADDFDEKSAGNPLTIYKHLKTGSAMQYSDCAMNTLELGVANGELLTMKGSIVGGNFNQIANVAASYMMGKHYTWDVASVAVAGIGKPEIMDATITFEEGMEAQHTLNGSKYPSRIKRTGFRSISIAGTLKFDDQIEFQNFLAQSEMQTIIFLKGTGLEIQSGYTEDIKFDFPAARYEELDPMAGGVGPIETSFTMRAKYHTGSGNSGTITLINTQAAY